MYALDLEALLYKLVHKYTGLPVYNHVPDDAIVPFIRIGDISIRPWLFVPPSNEASLVIAVFSEEESNQQAIEIATIVREILSINLTRQNSASIIRSSIPAIRIFQLKNLSWCAEIELNVHHYV